MTRFGLLSFAILAPLIVSGCGSKAPLGHEEFLYSAVGSSDVLGLGAYPLANGYPFRIQSELRDQGRKVAMLQVGIPTANTDIVTNAVRSAVDKGLRTEFATVWVGANDLISGVPVDTFASELNALIALLQDDMEAYVVIANLPALHTLPDFAQEPIPEVTEQRVAEYNAVINAVAVGRDIPVIDLVDDAIGNHLVNDFDGLHPDNEGHERMAMLFLKVIRPVL